MLMAPRAALHLQAKERAGGTIADFEQGPSRRPALRDIKICVCQLL